MRAILPLLFTALTAVSFAVPVMAASNGDASHPGAVIQSVPPPVAQDPLPPPLQLTDEQKAKIKQVLKGENTEVTFSLSTTKPTESFNPTIGAKIPSALKAHTLPPPLLNEMPALKQYTYLKFKGQVLIINPMTGKIVDIFPEA
jgi:hypothetical protein